MTVQELAAIGHLNLGSSYMFDMIFLSKPNTISNLKVIMITLPYLTFPFLTLPYLTLHLTPQLTWLAFCSLSSLLTWRELGNINGWIFESQKYLLIAIVKQTKIIVVLIFIV